MNNPWEATITIDESLVTTLLEHQFTHLKPLTLEKIGEGWDNVVYRVNDKYVFRFPRRQEGADLVETEWKLLPSLARLLPLPIPTPTMRGNPADNYPWHFLGYHYLEGSTGCAHKLTIEQRATMAKPLAHFLKALHGIPKDKALKMGATYDYHVDRLDLAVRSPQAHRNLTKIKKLSLFDNTEQLFDLLAELKNVRDQKELQTLTHGDLYARHMLIGKNNQLTGIIDWGDAHVGNPAVDLSIAFSFLPPDARTVFFQTYGAVSENILQLAQFQALRHTTNIMIYSHEIKDEHLFNESVVGLTLLPKKQL